MNDKVVKVKNLKYPYFKNDISLKVKKLAKK